ncbi:MAG: DUF86 domain-containing protein [Nanoarchaeota archaeon]|nr:DUF86 domain-containing protein [Nanoarchaeota archaeon]
MDKNRIITKIAELDSYLEELDKIKPDNFDSYIGSIEKKRACERLFKISIETVLDICNIIISELKLGLPSNEEQIFDKLLEKKIISNKIMPKLKGMKGFRNILVHKYSEVKDELVFENIDNLEDFDYFKEEILRFLKTQGKENKIRKDKA